MKALAKCQENADLFYFNPYFLSNKAQFFWNMIANCLEMGGF